MDSKDDIEKLDVTFAERRMELSGPSGIAGLVKQPRLLKLTLITTLGAVRSFSTSIYKGY